MKLDKNDIKYLAAAFKSIKEQIQVATATAAEAWTTAAIALKAVKTLVDEETINKATEEVGLEVGETIAKGQQKEPLSPGEAFKKYGGGL